MIVLSTHTTFHQLAPELLFDYLSARCRLLFLIMHPFEQMRFESSFALETKGGKSSSEEKLPRIMAPSFVLFAKDLMSSVFFVLKTKRRYHLFVGADPLNTLAGLILRRFGFASTVVFWSIDFSPIRFKNRIMNSIYHFVEKLATQRSDCTWCASREISNVLGRLHPRKMLVVVPGAPTCEVLPVERINRTRIVYAGDLSKEKGVDTIIRAIPLILEKCPNSTFLFIGSGPLETTLRAVVHRWKLEQVVLITGHLKSGDDVWNLVRECSIGVAPYAPVWYEPYAFPGKALQYCARGLPVIMTRISSFADEVERRGAGIIIKYDPTSLSEAAEKFLLDDNLYYRARQNAVALASSYNLEKIFGHAILESLIEAGPARCRIDKINSSRRKRLSESPCLPQELYVQSKERAKTASHAWTCGTTRMNSSYYLNGIGYYSGAIFSKWLPGT
jgi:glycosyltransferase involved in cell wall biosynthesis